jgi:NTP pyrophosphatase (non-canonical NTP hydrolase)
MRPAVRAFALAMERELRINDYKGGWHETSPGYLMERLREETQELVGAMARKQGDPHSRKARILSEAADTANFAMMIADVAGALGGKS